MRCLIEFVALLTKSMGIVTPLILSILVCVALRLILYIEKVARSYRTRKSCLKGCQIVLYKGFGVRKKEKSKRSSPTYLHSEWSPIKTWQTLIMKLTHNQCCQSLSHTRSTLINPNTGCLLCPCRDVGYFTWIWWVSCNKGVVSDSRNIEEALLAKLDRWWEGYKRALDSQDGKEDKAEETTIATDVILIVGQSRWVIHTEDE